MGETSFRRSVESGVVAILRATSSNDLLNATDAVLAGGVSSIEVTITTPGALRIVEEARARFGDEVSFGVGTVLDAESARAALLAGAQPPETWRLRGSRGAAAAPKEGFA